jgi:GH25 family lysozyme M1 (1,4-beta-N-acetylmuramidase)
MQIKFNPKGRDIMNLLTFLSRFFSALAHAKEAADNSTAEPARVSTVDTQSAAPPGWEGAPPYRYIDVSRYQGKITLDGWRKIKAAGYKGVMLKTISTNSKLSKRKDGLYVDPTFETNYRNARAAGLDVGVYYYTYATSEAMADAELALLRQAVYGKELTLPVAVDVEENKLKQLSTLDLSNLTAYALEQVERMGFYAQLYTYTGYKYELDMARLSSRWDVWLADYTGKTPKVDFKYNAHQHTSKGNVPGISGNVDLNVTTRNYPKIIAKKGLTRLREGK